MIVLISGIVAVLQTPDPQPIKPKKSFFEWVRYPIEGNPGLRIPSAPAQLNAVAFSDDAENGIVVGEGGTILASTDGGETWTEQNSGVINTLYGVYCGSACKKAWAVGSNGTILNSIDGGKLWRAQRIDTTDDIDLLAVQFRKESTLGWVIGRSGSIWATHDGGENWYKQNTADTRDFRGIFFDEQGQRGWVVGTGGAILTTSDGGANWTAREVKEAKGASLYSVTFTSDGEHGWISGGRETVLLTKDGGEHWQSVSIDPQSTPEIYPTIQFDSSGRRGWVHHSHGTIFSTIDGGRSWNKQDSGVNAYMAQLRFDAEGRHGWAVGGSGTILSTKDGGKTWVTRTSSKSSHLFSIHLDATGNLAIAVGDAEIIVGTTDGGIHWSSQASGVDKPLYSVAFLADNVRGWAVGGAGTIIVTNDGGEHWSPQKSPSPVPLNDVGFDATGRRGLAIGNSAVVITTDDGGDNWVAQSIRGASNLNHLSIDRDAARCWLTANGGHLFHSEDGGRSWTGQKLQTETDLFGIWFDDDGKRAWTVGNVGTIFFTNDGGLTWSRQQSGTSAGLAEVRFLPGGLQGWIVGDGGTILATTDGGKHWSATKSKVGSTRNAIAFASNGLVGWAVGYPPALEKTDDGGTKWEPITWPLVNERYPPPWFWLALAVAAFCFWLSVRIDPGSAKSAIDAMGTSDAPIDEFAQDRLQFGSLARGLSRFLRNTNTQPPLTVSISGDWGSGKSTLMELVSADLRRYGIKPVWFNAWHHQQEEQLLAALLNSIRNKGLPPTGSADGLAFRFRLLLTRSKKHFVIALATIAGIAALIGYLLGHDFSEWTNLWNAMGAIGANLTRTKQEIAAPVTLGDASWLSAQIIGGAAALYSLYRGITAFKIDPAVLLSNTAENFKLKNASAQTNFRSDFAKEFDEVTHSLPYTMVIVIDDLDRCQPATVLTIMEAVNFLVSSGKCFVIFGMATDKVEAALMIEFEKIADMLAVISKNVPTETDKNPERNRLHYVRDYLDKLINIDILVPKRSDILPHLLDDLPRKQSPIILGGVRQYLEFWPAWTAGIVLIFGLLFGFEYSDPKVAVQKALPSAAQAVMQQSAKPDQPNSPNSAILIPVQISTDRYVPSIQQNKKFVLDKLTIAITFALVVGIAGGILLYGLRTTSRRVYDSPAFREALGIWLPVVQCRRVTPRGIKRFGNRLRYLAMLQQHGSLDETGFDKFRKWLERLMTPFRNHSAPNGGKPSSEVSEPGERELTESLLVALTSLYEVFGLEWRSHLQATADNNLERAIKKGN